MVQPPVVGRDRGIWGPKLLDYIDYKTDGLATDANLDALAAQVSGNIAAIDAVDTRVDRVDPGATGSPLQELGIGPDGIVAWKNYEWVNLQRRGAVADAATDNTAVLQATIDELSARTVGGQIYGGVIFVPDGVYRVGRITMKSNVIIYAPGYVGGVGHENRSARFLAQTTGVNAIGDGQAMFGQGASQIRNVGIVGISIQGDGGTTASLGIDWNNVNSSFLHGLWVSKWGAQAIRLLGNVVRISDVFAEGLKSATFRSGLAARVGAFEITNGVDFYLYRVESTGPNHLAVSSASLYCAAAHWYLSSSFVDTCVFQTGDVGLSIFNSSSPNHYMGCRFDTNAAHGLLITGGTANKFVEPHFFRNSWAGNGLYDHIHIPASGGALNTFLHPVFSLQSGKIPQYCINDLRSSQAFRNRYIDPEGDTGTVGFYNLAASSQSRVHIHDGGMVDLVGATPSVLNARTFRVLNAANTTVTNFLGGVHGQEIRLVGDAGAGDTTIQNNASIVNTSGADILMTTDMVLSYVYSQSAKWLQV